MSMPRVSEPTFLRDIPWWLYLALREATEEQHLRLTYLDGTLEITAPWALHEEAKKLLARLLAPPMPRSASLMPATVDVLDELEHGRPCGVWSCNCSIAGRATDGC